VILAEIDVDVRRSPTEKHFASWLRLCPPQNRSNNRILKYGQEYATQAMEGYEARMLDALKRKAAVMGFQLSPPPTE